jgi:uncharacterized protein (DUF1330 family)
MHIPYLQLSAMYTGGNEPHENDPQTGAGSAGRRLDRYYRRQADSCATGEDAPAYVVAEVEVTDPTTLKKYGEKAPQIVASFNGHYVVRGGKVQALEGEPPKGYVAVIGFDSVEKAREWYDSPAYSAIRPFRQSSTKSRLFIVEGVAPQ